ncbi:MAG: trypsin-like peptidase domain-containing protein [Bacteroidetes bacterium]|nr:trypsin-like peptidase domain-containing protein [Bacteroidota bacterium]
MDDILLLDAVERYLRGEMSAEERTFLEEMRKKNPEIDQLVVEHTYFLNELDQFGSTKNFKHNLVEVETRLIEEGVISPAKLKGKAKVVYLWKRYRRIAAVAATIAGFVSLITAGVTSVYNNKQPNSEIELLNRKFTDLDKKVKEANNEIREVKGKIDPKFTLVSGGTGFLIDGQGYLITNNHVLKGKTIIATNDKGQQFYAEVCMRDDQRDIAVLKIADKDYVPVKILPYGISNSVNLAEPIYTVGFPKDDIVYNEGYMSSETGNKGDTLTYQIAIAADHGNSGGPVLNKNGDIIGILTKKAEGNGAVFAVKSRYIFNVMDALKKDTSYADIKLNTVNSIKNLDRVQQVKKVNNCVFLIKSYQ